MSTYRKTWIAGVAAIACASGCGDEAPRGADERIGEASSALAATCPGTRQIGIVQQGASCPAPASGSNWVRSRLFDGLTQQLPASLAAYCLYEWTGSGAPDHGALPSYQGAPPSSWLDPDCMSVASMTASGNAAAAITPELEQAFFAQIEAPVGVPAAENGGAVRVAVVDAWPDVARVGTFDHGFGMAAIARRVACGPDPAPCFLTLAPHLALDLIEPDVRNTFNGGFFGYQGRLARAIAEAVFARAATAPNDPLVINLSVGWDGRFNAGPHGPVSAPVLAVHAALQEAACAHALVIAAAGNAGSGPTPGGGPVYPAAWEQELAPSCAGPLPRPLVYAVGGVDGRDLPLASTRPGARPVLAAAFVRRARRDERQHRHGDHRALHGLVRRGRDRVRDRRVRVAPEPGAPARRGDGPHPHERRRVRRSGRVLPDGALRARAPDLALPLARAGDGHLAHVHEDRLRRRLQPDVVLRRFTAIVATATDTYDGRSLVTLDAPPICDSDVFVPYGLSHFPGPWPCPSDTLPNSVSAPAVGPQPPPDPCPACILYPDPLNASVLVLAINQDVPTAYPQILTLSLGKTAVARYDIESAVATSGDLLVKGLTGGDVYRVLLPPITLAYGVGFEYATIDWVNTPDAETTSALIVGR